MTTTIRTAADISRAVQAGVSLPAVLRDLFSQSGTTAKAFCLKHQIQHPHLSRVAHQKEVPSSTLLVALAAEFGGEEAEWAEFFPRPFAPGHLAAGAR